VLPLGVVDEDESLGGDKELLLDDGALLELLGVLLVIAALPLTEDEVSVEAVLLGVEVDDGVVTLLLAVVVGGGLLLVVVSLWLQAVVAAPAARMTSRGISFFMSSPELT
jgi:hypothetical protein